MSGKKPASEAAEAGAEQNTSSPVAAQPDEFANRCGLVMPISAIDDCSVQHWDEVRNVLTEAARDAGFEAALVSESQTTMIIQKTIVQNLYRYPLVICDVSAKNANVMFELGMRLCFGKPTIVVKDDQTSYSFDTSPFRHILYPRGMNYHAILDFKRQLTTAIKEIVAAEAAGKHEGYLTTFAAIESVALDKKSVPAEKYIVDTLKTLSARLGSMESLLNRRPPYYLEERIKFSERSHRRNIPEVAESLGAENSISSDESYDFNILVDPSNVKDVMEILKDDVMNGNLEIRGSSDGSISFRAGPFAELGMPLSMYVRRKISPHILAFKILRS